MSRKDNREKVKNTTDRGVAGGAGAGETVKGKNCTAQETAQEKKQETTQGTGPRTEQEDRSKDHGQQTADVNGAESKDSDGGSAEAQQKPESAEDLLKKELAEQKDRYLRLSAEFDNYRRRVAKEKLELIETAGEGVIKSLLPVVDDFERAIKALEGSTDAESAKEGTNLIYKKLQELLKSRGVSEIETEGKELDTDVHEAVAQFPAPDPKLKGKIVDCVQKGYRLGGKVIRFAKVVVGV